MFSSRERRLSVAVTASALAGMFASTVLHAQPQAGTLEKLKSPPWAGLWTGNGVTFEKLMDDPIRKLVRRSESSFWFIVGEDGSVSGEAIVAYSAKLEPIKFKVPVPNVGSIEAEVGGEAPKRFFRVGVSGQLVDAESGLPPSEEDWDESEPLTLELAAMGTDEEGKATKEEKGRIPGVKYEFTLSASLVIPAGWGMGQASDLANQVPTGAMKGALEGIGIGSGVLPGASPGVWTIPIPATGWSPFQGMGPETEHGPGEPYRVTARKDWENGSFVFWNAVQQSASLDKLNRLVDRVRVLENLRVGDLEATVTRLRAEVETLSRELAKLRAAIAERAGPGPGSN